MKNESGTIVTKLDLSWYMLFLHLEEIRSPVLRIGDGELTRRYTELINYVDNMLALPKGDITKIYISVEQNVPPKKG